jgi:hypothetical protein
MAGEQFVGGDPKQRLHRLVEAGESLATGSGALIHSTVSVSVRTCG